ncbi:unnamed protein product [Ceutorhynchus assimilis]|uniref:Uncharacterized protein n=1 Tax=Ceutorhynchus assimilis TaxID=467358 RepID=A0A9N9MHN7_9CUCU|nr:unnamed protein product [Ceutorhynchus assimilis]
MGVPELSNCCGVSLKHGTIIIGVLNSIGAFTCMMMSAAYAVHPHELIEMNDDSVVPKLEILKGILITIAVASALQCIFSILLIFGAASNHPSLLTPWLVLNPVGLFVYVVGTLIAIIHHTGNNSTPYVVGHVFFSVWATVMVGFQLLVIYSFRTHLKRLNF